MMDFKKLSKFIFSWLITIFIFIVLFYKIKFSAILDVLRQADTALIFLSILLSLIAHIVLAPARYREILKVFGCGLSFFETLILQMGSTPMKGIIPLKLGEVSRVTYLKNVHRVSVPRGTGSILLGYILSLSALTIFVYVGWFFRYLGSSAVAYIGFVCLALLFAALVSRVKSGPILLFYSLGFEGFKLLNALLIFKALHIAIPCSIFLLLAPVFIIIASLPITVWGLGARESVILLLFSRYATPEELLGGGLLVSFVNIFFPVVVGLFFIKPFLNRLLGIHKKKEQQ